MGFDDDDEDAYATIVKAYKIVMTELISRADTIDMVDDDDYVRIIIGRSFGDNIIIERRVGKFLRDSIDVTENGLLISDEYITHHSMFKGLFKRIKMMTTVANTIFLPWHLVADIRLEQWHHQRDILKDETNQGESV